MLESIVDLTKARPHMRESARFNTHDARIYAEGYYTGVIYALRVAEEARQRFALAVKTRRAANRIKRSA